MKNDYRAAEESFRRKRAWLKDSKELIAPPLALGLDHSQEQRRREFFQSWRWLGDGEEEIRRRAARENRQAAEILRDLEHRQYLMRQEIERRDREAYYLLRQIEELKPHQIFKKSDLSGKLRVAQEALREAQEEKKKLALDEKKLYHGVPQSAVEQFSRKKEAEREKALAELMKKEADEKREREEQARRREERENRPSPRPQARSPRKSGGWTPPRPS